MHPSSRFHWDHRGEMLAFVHARSFATLVDAALHVAQVPLFIDGDRALLHLSRNNPLARAMPTRVVAVVAGADAYISPDWYASSDQVPTWNYESVEIEGTLTATDDAQLLEMLARLSAEQEGRIVDKRPWTMDKVTPSTLTKLTSAIVGATLSIEQVRGTRKLSQNKTDADVEGVIAGLHRAAGAAGAVVADRIRAVRPPHPDR